MYAFAYPVCDYAGEPSNFNTPFLGGMEALWGGFAFLRGLMVRINFLYELSYASLSYVFQEYGNTSIKDINRYNFFKILAIYRTNIRYYDNEQRGILVVLKLGHGAIYKRFISNDAAHRLGTAMIIGSQYSQDYMRSSIRGIKHVSEAQSA